MKRVLTAIRRAIHWFSALSLREKVMVIVATVVGGVYLGHFPIEFISANIEENQRLFAMRSNEIKELGTTLKRYRELRERLSQVESTFQRSQMTFQQVTEEIDSIVKKSIGKDSYELKKARDAAAFGLQYEKQDFTLRIKNVTLEQLVNLLHTIEQGTNPLFIGKADIVSTSTDSTDFSVTLEISSIGKARS